MDYDGTLTPTHKLAEFAKPSSNILSILSNLAKKEHVYVYIISGRSRSHLSQWFDGVGVGLSAEHGCFYRHPEKVFTDVELTVSSSSESAHTADSKTRTAGTGGWVELVDDVDLTYRDAIRPLLQHYTDRTPGSFIEEKEMNLTWHYRNADPEFGSWQASELNVNLEKILSHMAVSIILGNKTLELRPSAVDKATAAKCILQDFGLVLASGENSPAAAITGPILPETAQKMIPDFEVDFVLAVGDGKTDEIVFSMLGDCLEGCAITATVGKKQTAANFYLEDVQEVSDLLTRLSQV